MFVDAYAAADARGSVTQAYAYDSAGKQRHGTLYLDSRGSLYLIPRLGLELLAVAACTIGR